MPLVEVLGWGEIFTFEATADILSAIQAPPKKALLSREQFEEGGLEDRDGQVPMS